MLSEPAGKPIVIGAEGNYFGEIVSRYTFSSATMAETRYTKGAELPPHRHEFMGFFLVLSGRFQTSSRRRVAISGSGDLDANRPHELHSVRLLSENGRGFSVELPSIRENSVVEGFSESMTRATRVHLLMRQLHWEMRYLDAASGLAVEGLVLQVEAELLRVNGKPDSPEPASLRNAVEFLWAHSDKYLSMADLAQVCGIPCRELFNVFRTFKGCSPAEYHRRLRLTLAQRKLSGSALPIAQIASESGFYDQAHFSNSFRKMFGCTPLRYRQLLRRS